MTLKEMQEKSDQLVAQARAALAEIRANADDSRAAELEQRHDTIMAEFDKLEADIKREERVAAAEAALEHRTRQRRPGANGDVVIGGEGNGGGNGGEPDGAISYRSAFYKFLAVGADPSALTTEERSALRIGVQQLPAEVRAQVAGTNNAGGYLVPTELASFIIAAMKAHGPMLDGNIVTDITTAGGNPFTIPTVDDTANEAAARAEMAELVDDASGDVVIGQKRLDAYVFATPIIRFSMELAADSPFAVEPLLGGLVGERLGRNGNRRLTTGTGAGQPNGIVTASSLGTTAAATAAVTFDELFDLEHSVDPAYRVSPKCRFMFNDSFLKAVRKLKDGEGRYVWQQGNVQAGVPASLNGRPYSINQHMDSLAAAKKVALFGDFSKYYVRKVGQPLIGTLRERYFPDLGIVGLHRIDGELGDTNAVKHLITAA